MIGRAKALAARVNANAKESNRARVERVYQILFAREPDREELQVALEFLRQPESKAMTRWEQYAQIVLASNEMMYVD